MSTATLTLRDPCPPKTRSDLEYGRVLSALADRCHSELGKKLALALPFADTREATRRLLDEAEEATALLAAGEPLPSAGLVVRSFRTS